jgi:hypothetical protein
MTTERDSNRFSGFPGIGSLLRIVETAEPVHRLAPGQATPLKQAVNQRQPTVVQELRYAPQLLNTRRPNAVKTTA